MFTGKNQIIEHLGAWNVKANVERRTADDLTRRASQRYLENLEAHRGERLSDGWGSSHEYLPRRTPLSRGKP